MFCVLLLIFFMVLWAVAKFRLNFGVCKSHRCLIGKTAIVTGGNAGIGYEICLNLASRGCKVIIADIADSEQSRLNIIKKTHNRNIHSMKLNLASFKSIRDFAQEINKQEDRLDILVHNAGICIQKQYRTQDGYNNLWQVNYLGPFLLTHLLVDLLKKSAPSRIVFTSSLMSVWWKFDATTIQNETDDESILHSLRIYASSKTAVLIASQIFAEKLKNSGVTSNATHPSTVFGTNIVNVQVLPLKHYILNCLFEPLVQPLSKTPWFGAQTTTHVAISEELDGVTGEFFGECEKRSKPSALSDRILTESFWKLSEKYVQLSESEKI